MLIKRRHRRRRLDSHHDFVFAQEDTISTQLPVVSFSQSRDDGLHPAVGLIKIGSSLVSQQLLVGSHSTEHDHHSRSDGVLKEFILAMVEKIF